MRFLSHGRSLSTDEEIPSQTQRQSKPQGFIYTDRIRLRVWKRRREIEVFEWIVCSFELATSQPLMVNELSELTQSLQYWSSNWRNECKGAFTLCEHPKASSLFVGFEGNQMRATQDWVASKIAENISRSLSLTLCKCALSTNTGLLAYSSSSILTERTDVTHWSLWQTEQLSAVRFILGE